MNAIWRFCDDHLRHFFLLGGLGLFLYGMSLMSDGLNLIAGSQLKKILQRLTRNKWFGAF